MQRDVYAHPSFLALPSSVKHTSSLWKIWNLCKEVGEEGLYLLQENKWQKDIVSVFASSNQQAWVSSRVHENGWLTEIDDLLKRFTVRSETGRGMGRKDPSANQRVKCLLCLPSYVCALFMHGFVLFLNV